MNANSMSFSAFRANTILIISVRKAIPDISQMYGFHSPLPDTLLGHILEATGPFGGVGSHPPLPGGDLWHIWETNIPSKAIGFHCPLTECHLWLVTETNAKRYPSPFW